MDTCYDGIAKRYKLEQIKAKPNGVSGKRGGATDSKTELSGVATSSDRRPKGMSVMGNADSFKTTTKRRRQDDSTKETSKRKALVDNIKTYLPKVAAATEKADVEEITLENSGKFLDKYDTFLLDCDGVTWKTDSNTPIPGVKEAIARLQRMGKRVIFVSNNSLYSRKTYAEKFKKFGINADPENILCASYAAAVYLKQIKNITSSIYVVGIKTFADELSSVGLKHFGAGEDPDPPFQTLAELQQLEYRNDVGAVLVGIDTYFNLNKLAKASTYLLNPECQFVTVADAERSVIVPPRTGDKSVFTPPKICAPISGAILDAIKSASDRNPVVVGKPQALFFQCIRTAYPDVKPERTVMIGDTLFTDVQFASKVGIDAVLVLSGLTSFQVMKESEGPRPRYFMQSLAVLAEKAQ